MSSETGIIECSIRLPCDHLVGSHCLATWFHHNNSCPICRREFFSAQPQPRLEHETAQEDGDGGDHDDAAASSALSTTSDDSGEEDDSDIRLSRLLRDTRCFSHRLRLMYAAEYLAQLIAKRMFHMDALLNCRRSHKAAVSNFVAAHLVHHRVTLDQMDALAEFTQGTLLDCYRMFYPERETVINREFLFLLREDPERVTRGDLPALDWPLPDFTGMWWDTIADKLETRTGNGLIQHSRRIFLMLMNQTYFNAESSSNVAALSIYLASCLGHTPTTSCGEIASAMGVNESDVRTIYALFYPHRQDLLEHRAVDSVVGDRYYQRLIECLPREVPPPVEERTFDS